MPKIFFPSSKPIFLDREKIIGELKEFVSNLCRKDKKIEEAYLFGSYANGTESLHSDADILVVLSDDDRNIKDRLGEYVLKFAEASIPVDVLVYTKEELNKALKDNNNFLIRALSGIKLK